MSYIRSDKFEPDFDTFREKYPPGKKQDCYVSQMCGWFEALGALWVNGLLNEKLIGDWVAPAMFWDRVKGYALGIRELTGKPAIFEHFEALANTFK